MVEFLLSNCLQQQFDDIFLSSNVVDEETVKLIRPEPHP